MIDDPGSALLAAAVPRDELGELAPVLRRAVDLDPGALARFRTAHSTTQILVRLPFRVLVARSITVGPTVDAATGPAVQAGTGAVTDAAATEPQAGPARDLCVRAADALAWFDGVSDQPVLRRDVDWRGGVPPWRGWRRVDLIPDSVVRDLVRTGALALQQAARREGVPGAQPRASVADALLDSVVLTASSDTTTDRAELTLRTLSALTRMGFVPRQSEVAVDVLGRWTRVAATYGSVYAERADAGLGVIRI